MCIFWVTTLYFLDWMTCALCMTEGKVVIFSQFVVFPLISPINRFFPCCLLVKPQAEAFFLRSSFLSKPYNPNPSKLLSKTPQNFFLFVRWKFSKSLNNFSSPRITKFLSKFALKFSQNFPHFSKTSNETLTFDLAEIYSPKINPTFLKHQMKP